MMKCVSAAISLSLLGATAWAQQTGLHPEDTFKLEAVANPQISPDGTLIAYLRRSNDIISDQTLSAIWLIEPDGDNHRALSVADGARTGSPVWSDDGRYLAYSHTLDGVSSIRVFDSQTGEDRQLAEIAGGAAALQWSPDGRHLAYAGFVVASGPEPAYLLDYDARDDWAAPAIVEDRLTYRIDGIGTLPHGGQQIFTLDTITGERSQITEGALSAGSDFAWAPDGKSFYISVDRRPDAGTLAADTELFSVDIGTGHFEPITDRRGPDNTPRPSPSGRFLAYLGYDDQLMGYHNTGLYLRDLETSESRRLSGNFDRSINAPVWAEDESGLYFSYQDHGETIIAFIDLSGEIETITTGLGSAAFGRPYAGGSFSVADNGQLAFGSITATRPAELATGSAADGFSILTALNEDVLADRYISDAEEIRWASPYDGMEVQGWVLYPPDYDPARQYPMILEIHGGPFSAYGPVFSAEFQLMAAAGYVVVYTNPRGSTSYGYAFANEIHHAYPGNDHHDLMGAVDLLVERGIADPDRLFITGGSGGGTLTAWAIGQTDRFAAAAVVKPVINWGSFVLHADLPQFFYRYWFPAAPWEDPEHYWARSPLSLVGNVDTPTLMMVGGADIRTPVSETEQYYTALRLRGVPSELVVIPDSYHGISNSRPSRLLTKVAEILRWFERYDPVQADAE